MAIKAVLFDIDGTLVDSNDDHVTAWQAAFAGIGRHFDRQAIHDQIGKGTDMLVPTLSPELDEAAQEELGEAQGAVFKARFLPGVRPFPGAADLVRRVHDAGKRVVLASSASQAELDHYTELLGIADIVGDTTSADEVDRTKPAPDIFASALGKVAPLAPTEVMAIGDTPYDVEAARRCGIGTIGLRSGGFPDRALEEAGAVTLYDDVAALLRDFDGSPLAG